MIRELKPDFAEAAARWEAYWNHDVYDRPVLCAVLAPEGLRGHTYRDRVFGDLDEILNRELENARKKQWLGDSVPGFWPSLGTHEIASYCGFEIEWGPVGDMNWAKPSGAELAEMFPIAVDKNGFWYKRAVEVYQRAREVFQGRLIPYSLDFHTNLDLLLSIRGDAELCCDLYDCPQDVHKALEYAREVFKTLWQMFKEASGCDSYGYFFDQYSSKPTTSLACDFCALIGPEMFKEFALPTLIYESELVGDRTIYHWDGPDAIKHKDYLISIPNLHTFRYVPSPGSCHAEFIELYRYCQDKGKSIGYTGTPDEIKMAHKVLDPEKTCYHAIVRDEAEFRELEKWLKQHM